MKNLFCKKAVCALLIGCQLVAFSVISDAAQIDLGWDEAAQDSGMLQPTNLCRSEYDQD